MLQGMLTRIGTTAGALSTALAIGVGIGSFYENTVPWGLRAQRDRIESSIPERERAARDAQLAADRIVLAGWQQRLSQCQADQRQQSEDVATTLDAAADRINQSRDAAYTLGRQAGLAQCRRSNNAESGGPAGDAVPAAGVLPDDVELRDVLAGAAYRPSPR